MGYSKITALSLTDLFVQQIENMILSGELAFGEQLPPARELAAKVGVSRTVVTAGLVELEKLGFVEIKARQGVYVCDYRRHGTMETLVAIMRYNGGALRQNEVRSLLETRDAMECMCMRLVVERSDTASLEALAPGFGEHPHRARQRRGRGERFPFPPRTCGALRQRAHAAFIPLLPPAERVSLDDRLQAQRHTENV